MRKRRMGLLFRFGIIFLILIIVTLIISGVATYANQNRIFQEEEEKNLRAIADYLSEVLQHEGRAFPMYQRYLLSHKQEPDIPVAYTQADAVAAKRRFERLFAQAYPGAILGEDCSQRTCRRRCEKPTRWPATSITCCCSNRRRQNSASPTPTMWFPRRRNCI